MIYVSENDAFSMAQREVVVTGNKRKRDRVKSQAVALEHYFIQIH